MELLGSSLKQAEEGLDLRYDLDFCYFNQADGGRRISILVPTQIAQIDGF